MPTGGVSAAYRIVVNTHPWVWAMVWAVKKCEFEWSVRDQRLTPHNPKEMQSIVSKKAFAAKPIRAARPAARPVKAMAFKVTLKTPSGACRDHRNWDATGAMGES